jgi:hypothetical protein
LYDFADPLLECGLRVGYEAVRIEGRGERAKTALHDLRSIVTAELQTAPAEQFLLPKPSLSPDLLRRGDQRQATAILPRPLEEREESVIDIFRQLKSHNAIQRRILHPAQVDSQHKSFHVRGTSLEHAHR